MLKDNVVVSDVLFGVNTGLTGMMKIANALNEKDYIQAALIFIDMDLKAIKNRTSAMSFSLEEARPALKLLRKTIQVFHANEGSEYYDLEFNEKLKIVIASWKESAKEAVDILKRYIKIFEKDVKSGKFEERVSTFFQKIAKKIKGVFYMFFKKRRH